MDFLPDDQHLLTRRQLFNRLATGIDHTKLTFRFQGRDFRLTAVEGNVVKGRLA